MSNKGLLERGVYEKNKKIIIALVILFIMIIPIPFKQKDGGSVEYKAILYKITKYHMLNAKSTKGYDDGWQIKIIGITIYDEINTYSEAEHRITIISNDKKIEAVTGSFCYKNGSCIDKVDFQDFRYDVISSYYNNKLYIDNLEGNILSIDVFDFNAKKFLDTKVEFTNEYIITPYISDLYIIKINATFENKKIEYYFEVSINEISGEEINVQLELKENTLSNKGLTMIVKNLSNKELEYSNPYVIEKFDNGMWTRLKTINDISFTLPAYLLKQNDSVELEINWEYGYGKLKGKYRIVKDFDYKDKDNYISFNKYLEFTIE